MVPRCCVALQHSLLPKGARLPWPKAELLLLDPWDEANEDQSGAHEHSPQSELQEARTSLGLCCCGHGCQHQGQDNVAADSVPLVQRLRVVDAAV